MTDPNNRGFWGKNLLEYCKQSFRPVELSIKLSPLILIGVLIAILWNDASKGSILQTLSKPDIARGIITLLFAVSTVWIIMLLTIAAISNESDDDRFKRGKDVLLVLVGIFGTIMGYYFGTEKQQNLNTPPAGETVPEERQLPSGENQNNSQ